MGSKESKPDVDAVFAQLDEDKSGAVSVDELHEWQEDEQFAGNPDLKTVVPMIHKLIDVAHSSDKTSVVTRAQIDEFFGKLKDEEIIKITRSMSTSMTNARVRMLKAVFDALDVNGDGRVTRAELYDWLKHHDVFSYKELNLETLNKRLLPEGVDKNSKVQFGDFKDVFKEWPVRSIRRASEQLRQEKVEREESKKKPGQQQLVGFDL